jgi:hypothetical protein
MKKAWIENNKVRDIANGNPLELFHPDIAIHFNTDVEDTVLVGAESVNGVWVNPTIATIVEAVKVAPLISPIEFKMLFSAQERIAIKASVDPVVQDFISIVEDPRLNNVDRNLQSVKDALNYLELINLIAKGRALEILL